jgi:hypothetical protein
MEMTLKFYVNYISNSILWFPFELVHLVFYLFPRPSFVYTPRKDLNRSYILLPSLMPPF